MQGFSGISGTQYSYAVIRLKFVSLSNASDVRYLYYSIMLHGKLPSDTSTEKYIELVKSSSLETGIWYELYRNPMTDINWNNVKVTQIALVIAFYYGPSYLSTDNARVQARFDNIGIDIDKTETNTKTTTRASHRSNEVKLDGSFSLKQNRTQSGAEFDIYKCGAESSNNSFYIAFPYYTNFSTHFYISTLQGEVAIQISLAIDDGPTYGSGYLYKLIYYYGSAAGVSPIFVYEPRDVIQVASSINTLSWTHLQKNWTADLPETWTLNSPRVEGIAFRIWTSNTLTVYWDLAAFYGKWYGVEKTVEASSINEIKVKKFNTTDYWSMEGGRDAGISDFIDNNISNVDNSPNKGTQSNFPAEKNGPDSSYDVLTE